MVLTERNCELMMSMESFGTVLQRQTAIILMKYVVELTRRKTLVFSSLDMFRMNVTADGGNSTNYYNGVNMNML